MVTGDELVDLLPVVLRQSREAQTVLKACASELELLEGAMDEITADLTPQDVSPLLLGYWERKFGIVPVGSMAARSTAVAAAARQLAASASGQAWAARLAASVGLAVEYEEGTGVGPPAANTVLLSLPYGDAILAPTGLAVGTKTSGGLSNGTYFWVVTAVNTYGETTASNEVSSTVTGGNGVVPLSWTAVAGAASYNVYRGTASGQEKLVGSASTNAHTDSGATPGTESPPVVNSTAPPTTTVVQRIARAITPAHIEIDYTYSDGFLVGVSRVGEETI